MTDNGNILITIIVPIYRLSSEQLHRCIDSLLEQDSCNEDYEILLIDDGSPDDCGDICDQYAGEHSCIRVIHQRNQGLSVVRNNGVQNALGEWVAFVDGDDWVDADFVSYAVESIRSAPVGSDILIWDGYSETPNGSTPIRFFDTTSPETMVFEGKKKEALIDRIIPRYVRQSDINRCTDIGVTWSRIYRKSFLLNHHIENVPGLRVMQDSVFNLWAFEFARTVVYQYKPIYHYSMYDESVSKKYDANISNVMKELYGYYAEYIKACHDEEDYWQRLYIRTVRMLVKCLAKDYANPLNQMSMPDRVEKMRNDLSASEFQTALQNCRPQRQELKFRVILFLLKHKLYRAAILASYLFGGLRRMKNRVS